MATIFKNEKDILLSKMWEIVLRETNVKDDVGCDWFTIGNITYIASTDCNVSTNEEVANLVNAINALYGQYDLINAVERSTVICEIVE